MNLSPNDEIQVCAMCGSQRYRRAKDIIKFWRLHHIKKENMICFHLWRKVNREEIKKIVIDAPNIDEEL